MSTIPHHPQCAVSLDVEPKPHNHIPRCTCWQWRRQQTAKRKLRGRGLSRGPLFLPDGVTALGNGNYIRTPLGGGGDYG